MSNRRYKLSCLSTKCTYVDRLSLRNRNNLLTDCYHRACVIPNKQRFIEKLTDSDHKSLAASSFTSLIVNPKEANGYKRYEL